MNIIEEARKQYFYLKKLYEENEARMREKGIPVPPRGTSFLNLQRRFEPTLSDDILAENNEVPMNKGWRIPRNG